jgi:UDP-3-O-[3-hydroxymyristoyl] N-acetylglucosamine deacetylase
MQRHTLQQPIRTTGQGIFLGREVAVTLHPAAAGHGLRFQRADVDLDVPVALDHLLEHETCSGLTDGRHRLLVVEHLLSVLRAFQITDLAVVVDGGELPFFDSTTQPWVELVQQAGVVDLEAAAEPLVVAETTRVEGPGKWIEARPGETFRVTYTLAHAHPMIGTDTAEYVEGVSDYAAEFAPAQSFITLAEARALYEMGLYQADIASFEEGLELFVRHALVVYDDHYSARLRVAHEFPKHKIVDLLGDLYFLGRPLQGHIIAYRTGHAENLALARKLAAQG